MLEIGRANHSAFRLKMDLQQFAGEEDAILPDDYTPESAQPEADEALEETVELESETTQTEQRQPEEDQTETQSSETPKFKVKFNHEEKELGYDEAVPLIQKGMNYDKLQEKLASLESDPRLAFVEQQAQRWNMSVPDYLEAIKAQEEQERLNELIQKNVPADIAQEILESRKDREERQSEKKANEEKAKHDAEVSDFLVYFKEANGRAFDPDKDTIPKEVWAANEKGTPLRYAYMEHHNKDLQSQIKVARQNEENLKKAPVGSVTTHGSTESLSDDLFIRGMDSI